MDFFENRSVEQVTEDGLYIESRQLSWLVSILLIFTFFVFWAGYFLGQKKVIGQFVQKIEHTLPFSDSVEVMPTEEEIVEVVPANSVEPVVEDVVEETILLSTVHPPEPITIVFPKEHYYAQLASFDSKKAAENCAQRLRTWDVEISVKKRHYRTPSGSEEIWYQVVTVPFSNKDELVALIDTMAKEEKLRDICYVCC